MNHFLLDLLVDEIVPVIVGRKIAGIRCLRPLVSIDLVGRGDPVFLVIVLATPGPFCFLSSSDPLPGIEAPALNRILGLRIEKADLVPGDRMLRIHLDESTLSILLFGSAAKVRVIAGDTIIDSIDQKERGIPVPARATVLETTFANADRQIIESTLALDNTRPSLTGLEVDLLDCFRADSGVIRLDALMAFRDRLAAKTATFFLGSTGRLGRATPLPFEHAGAATVLGPFDTVREGCAELGALMLRTAHERILDRYRTPVRKSLRAKQALAEQLGDELRKAEGFAVGRNEANILVAYQTRVPPGASSIELPDLYASGETVHIKLDPATPLAEQIQKRFKRATKLERSRTTLARRIEIVGREIADIESRLATADNDPDFAAALRTLEETVQHYDLLKKPSLRRGRPSAKKEYRRFTLDTNWFVLVGRSNKENDEITFKVAAPTDIWMHAQQVAGSHVVLKSTGASGNPPTTILNAAAAIAAHFSKAKHAGVVPVIYTRRKYVRKFRGAKPGEVTCEREQTLFVEPGVPKNET